MKVGIVVVVFLSCLPLSSLKRNKRAYEDNFNVLLNLYKMNPLKRSNVFKAFSNQILLPRPDGAALNYNINESEEKTTNMSPNPVEEIYLTKPIKHEQISIGNNIQNELSISKRNNYFDGKNRKSNYRIGKPDLTEDYLNSISNVNYYDDVYKMAENKMVDTDKFVDAEVVLV